MDAFLGIYYLQKYFPKILINHQKYNVSYTCNGLFKNEKWSDIEPELYLLKPKFAVSVGRKLIPEDFFKVMNTCLNKIDVGKKDKKKENFNNFVKFFEAIVAYHKYYESIGE